MTMRRVTLLATLVMLLIADLALANELTFELQERAMQCFQEDVKTGDEYVIDFQVVYGANLDVDVEIKDGNDKIIAHKTKVQYDSVTYKPEQDGFIKMCFSNQMSTIAHKTVYLNVVKVSEDDYLTKDISKTATALTQLEASMATIHVNMKQVLDYQTHHRLKEAAGRQLAEENASRVLWWSVLETLVVILCGLGQVMLVKRLFAR